MDLTGSHLVVQGCQTVVVGMGARLPQVSSAYFLLKKLAKAPYSAVAGSPIQYLYGLPIPHRGNEKLASLQTEFLNRGVSLGKRLAEPPFHKLAVRQLAGYH